MEAVSWQLVIDARDPHALADFWAAALGAEVEDNAGLIEGLLAAGHAQQSDTLVHRGRLSWRDLTAVRGAGPRILLQRVPEDKAVKNRLHVDLNVSSGPGGKERLRGEVDRLVALGAVECREWREPGGHWIAMTDPEGNEFDVQ
ncbi:VOC family protein [uncultured Friedmanniella sp.]|uniref:VOC family protein n=1 Tax=uncultured Friedmanniella sp. TaxID=335381 RepID=UPI0035C9C591